jgi:hypothetical protein
LLEPIEQLPPDQLDVWFGIMTREVLRGASFDSIEQRVKAIEQFVVVYNNNSTFLYGINQSLTYAVKYQLTVVANHPGEYFVVP